MSSIWLKECVWRQYTNRLICRRISVAAAKFTGSGGAVVVLCAEGQAQAQQLQALCSQDGFVMVKVAVGPPNSSD